MDAFALSEARVQDAPADESEAAESITVDGGNRFQKAISTWRSISLSNLVAQLDATASEIIENQKSALVERKDVAQRTKDFRKLDDPGKLAEYKSLLKAYQTFVDLLTNHGKTATSAFMQLYTPLSEAPDPFPLLEASVESLVASEETLPRLESENEQLRKRVNKLTSQLDETEQKLQAETKARKDAEGGSGTRVEEIEATWQKALEEQKSNWVDKERALEEKVENQDRLLKELKANYEVSQRLGQSGDVNGSASNAASAELDIVSAELERTSARLAEMQARNEQLRIELAQTASHSKASDSDEDVLRLRTENSALLRKLETTKYEKEAQKREWDGMVKQAERQRSSSAKEVEDLKARLNKQADYAEIRRELDMMRTIELSSVDDPDRDNAQANGDTKNRKETSLEQLLLARNKKLSSDLTLLRVSHQDMERQWNEMKTELTNTKAELEKSLQLSSKLEDDLSQVQEEAGNLFSPSNASVTGTYTSRYPASSRRGRSSPTSSIISGFDSQRHLGETPLSTLRSGEAVGGGSGILPMIQAQRDRFRKKNAHLEEELSKTYATVTSLRQEVASLQKDNLNLYEKTRYASAYSRGVGATSAATAFSPAPTHTPLLTDHDGEDADGRWKAKYEANLTSFAAFRGKEATRAYNRMSMPERMVFSAARIVLATRTSRNLFAGYLLGIHVFVLFMLYWMSAAGGAEHHAGKAASAILAESYRDDAVQLD